MPRVLVIIPTYNEIESLERIVGRLRQSLPHADVLIVDDSSPDGTGELADSLARSDGAIRVLHRPGKSGLGQAYIAGFRIALTEEYDYVVEIDADGSHDPDDLPGMLQGAIDGADLVIGSRWIPGGKVVNWPLARRVISRSGNRYARWALRSRIRDITAGFRVYRAEAIEGIDLERISSQGYCFQVELAWRLESSGRRIEERPITFVERATGRSKMHAGIVLEALVRVTGWGLHARFSRAMPAREAV